MLYYLFHQDIIHTFNLYYNFISIQNFKKKNVLFLLNIISGVVVAHELNMDYSRHTTYI